MLLFIGEQHRGYQFEEIMKKRDEPMQYITEDAHIKNQVIPILRQTDCTTMVFDVEQYIDDAEKISEEIIRLSNANNAEIIIFCPGYNPKSEIIRELSKRQIYNYIFSVNPTGQKEQIMKCITGYYRVNGMEEIEEIKISEEEEKSVERKFKSIAVAGTMARIGTTTQAIQIVKYLLLKGHKACYIELNDNGYVKSIDQYFECTHDPILGKVTYENTDMYYDIDHISEILHLDYDFYVYDYGVFTDTNFNRISYQEKDMCLMVCGAKPSEIGKTNKIFQSGYYNQVSYIFNFVSEIDKPDILSLMEQEAEKVFFAGYAPDPFHFTLENSYLMDLLQVEDKTKITEKRPWFKRKKREKYEV